nr:outer membrane beta-barrel protein [Methylocystis bryophila]
MKTSQPLTLAATAALLVMNGSALAADLPSRKAAPLLPPPPPPAQWSGFYGGLNAGYVFDASSQVTQTAGLLQPISGDLSLASGLPASFSADNSGFIGGGQIGYNYQFLGNYVVGLEADIQGRASSSGRATAVMGTNVNTIPGDFPFPAVRATSVEKDTSWLGTVRGRVGWVAMPQLLLYATGGLAYGDVKLSNNTFLAQPLFFGLVQTDFGGTSASDTRIGWTVGGGAEWMFAPNWSAKVEYLYYDLGSVNLNYVTLSNFVLAGPFAYGPSLGVGASARFSGHIARVGLNYHFNWASPAPVLAKY